MNTRIIRELTLARKSPAALACALMACCLSAQANDAITSANNEVGLSIGGENTSYHELASSEGGGPSGPDGYLDSNIGTIPAFGMNLTRQGGLFGISNVFLALDVTGAIGRTEYTTGAYPYQHCSGLPGTSFYCSFSSTKYGSYTESDQGFTIDTSVKLGKAFPIGASAQVTPYLTVGAQTWHRNVRLFQGNDDYYRNLEAGPGLLFQYSPTSRLVLGADFALEETFGAHAHEGEQDFALGSRPMETVALTADYAITKSLHATVSYSLQHFRYGASGVIDGTYEPSSWTTNQTAMLGLAFAY
jgi:hypothetical protein